jgi:hypothetical protein
VHCFSYIFGPQKASIISLTLVALINILFLLKKTEYIFEKEINNSSLLTLISTTLLICGFTYLSVFRFGIFDQIFHDPLALTLFHNDIYPPRDYFRPSYVILYHYGGDLLAGSIKQITGLQITRCFELVSTICSGINFLSFTALGWLLTRNFKLSYIMGFCTYFGGGLLWIDAILRFLSNDLPEHFTGAGFAEVFTTIGVHGSVVNAPSVLAFSSTSSLGIHMLIFSLIVFWQMINNKESKVINHLITLSISLLSLSICAEWLYLTFFASILPLTMIYVLKKDFRACGLTLGLTVVSFILNKTIGNALFLQDELQRIGRTSILNVGIKERLFEISAWGRLNPLLNNYVQFSCFSWDFISEFGFSLILLPLVIYLILKEKNLFAILLFFCALFTMPAPLILDFRTNPTDFNRMFCFGNEMLILLATYSISKLFKSFFQNKVYLFIYILIFCLSPLSQLLIGSIFTPHIYTSKDFSKAIFDLTNKAGFISALKTSSDLSLANRNKPPEESKEVIDFLIKKSKPDDVAISNQPDLPLYAGIYSLVPARSFIYQDQIYSPFSSIFSTVFSTFDPHLIKELNLKWIIVKLNENVSIPKDTENTLLNEKYFTLIHSSKVKDMVTKIFHVNDLKNINALGSRKTAWILVNKSGQPIEISNLNEKNISLFGSMKNSLIYLLELEQKNPWLNKDLITSQTIVISDFQSNIDKVNKSSGANIRVIQKP